MRAADRREISGILRDRAARVRARRGIGNLSTMVGVNFPRVISGAMEKAFNETLCPDPGFMPVESGDPRRPVRCITRAQSGLGSSGMIGAMRPEDCPPGTTAEPDTRRCMQRTGWLCRLNVQSLGDAASDLRTMPLPGALERYLATGAPMPAWKRDLGAMSAQVPRLVYGGAALLAIVLAAKSYRRWRDTK